VLANGLLPPPALAKGCFASLSPSCTNRGLLQPGEIGEIIEEDSTGTSFKVSRTLLF
jgi:hypothetical protein